MSTREYIQHGLSKTRAYKSWHCMRARCLDESNNSYRRYGGRGIATCDRWKNFTSFFEDMGERPEGMSLERKDNDKGYSLDNCKWATRKEQQNNTRHNKMIAFRGVTKSVAVWTQQLNMKTTTLYNRLRRGWSEERALTTPCRKWRSQ